MLRVVAQVMVGMMFLFGAITLAPRFVFHLRQKRLWRAAYFLLLWSASLFIAVLSFHYAYTGLTE